jgi:transketolase
MLQDTLAVRCLRGLALDMPASASSGHTGTALALAPLGWLLYSRVLRHDPRQPGWPNRDRLVLSNGHACVLLYGLLHLCGYGLSLEDLRSFRKPFSRTPGHPETWVTPGIDVSTGPLGQGLANAVGMALAERFLAARFGNDLVNHRTYVLCSDGDLMEGISHEASSLAGHQKLGKLIVFYDDNGVTIDGPGSLSWSEDVCARYRSYGWHVQEVSSGEDLDALQSSIIEAHADERPSLIRVRTVIGHGSPGLAGKPEAHSPPFPPEEIRATKLALGLDPEVSFWVPDLQVEFPPRAAEWGATLAASELREEWERWHRRAMPALPSLHEPMATRVASGKVLQSLVGVLPNLVGGSADLAGSTNAVLEGCPDQSADCPHGRNLRFGVREHAMAAVVNGLVQHGGVLAFCSTYFAFSDYMKPALRLAALAGIGSIFVWTHDSLALGEDGPTHQPVEQIATLRALPNFRLFRPADCNETVECWLLALAHGGGPSGLVLSRQTLPCLEPLGLVRRGAYVRVEAEGKCLVTLLASGSEVHLCLQVRELLGGQARVVSMPCWELFEEQDEEYRRATLGRGLRAAVECAASLGWHRWVGEDGIVVGLDRFGASGPGADLMAHFGFSAQRIYELIRKRLACV